MGRMKEISELCGEILSIYQCIEKFKEEDQITVEQEQIVPLFLELGQMYFNEQLKSFIESVESNQKKQTPKKKPRELKIV